MLTLEALTKCYPGLVAVDGLDLQVPAGQILGLLGPNGAGKSTSISMIAGVVRPTSGRVLVDGLDMRTQAMLARHRVGLVPQDIALYEELSAAQNLRFFASLFRIAGRELERRIDWALEVAKLSERRDDVVSEFSGGMKRRLNLAVGLLHRPKLLLLDEPTVGVDPQSRNHIFRSIEMLRSEEEMTVIYSSHYMEEVQALCDRVVIIDHGRIVDDEMAQKDSELASRAVVIDVARDGARAESAVAGLGAVQRSGEQLRIQSSESMGKLIEALERAGLDVVRAARSSSDLEERFLRLTGREMRDS